MTPFLALAPLAMWCVISIADHIFVPVIIVIPNAPDRDHLADVRQEMQRRGRPTIRAVRDGEKWRAIEGSHRCSAAATLGCGIEIKVLDPGEIVGVHDVTHLDSGEPYPALTAAQLAAVMAAPKQVRFPRWKVRVSPAA